MTYNVRPIILCGGSGTRLWPLSRKQWPKQFVPMFDGKSLLTLTCERLKTLCEGLGNPSPVIELVTNLEHRFLARQAADAAGVDVSLILEPIGRNTAAAMAATAMVERIRASESEVLLFVPADNYVPDHQAFAQAVLSGLDAALNGHWVIAGVVPSFPAEGYGYIQTEDESSEEVFKVSRFIEKPNRDQALKLLAAGHHYWNAGIFLVRGDVLLKSIERFRPMLLDQVRDAVAHGVRPSNEPKDFVLGDAFRVVENISIDYAVLEHQPDIRMVKLDSVWSDVGSWNSVATLTTEADAQGNRVVGHGLIGAGTQNCFIHALHRPVVALGVENLLIIDTADAVLVAHREAAEQVKAAVQELEARGFSQASAHRLVVRPWGSYDSIDAGDRFLVKRITVTPGASLSLQMHHHRAEHWIVVKGTAKVTRGEEVFLLSENESTYIPLGVKHRLENPGLMPLEMIEVQSGSFLSEEDIVRFTDQYGRALTNLES